jgi:hypothetical protein
MNGQTGEIRRARWAAGEPRSGLRPYAVRAMGLLVRRRAAYVAVRVVSSNHIRLFFEMFVIVETREGA